MTNIITKNYTIKERTFEASRYPVGSEERRKLNTEVLTSEYSPGTKYQLVCLFTEFGFKTIEECYSRLKKFGIPL